MAGLLAALLDSLAPPQEAHSSPLLGRRSRPSATNLQNTPRGCKLRQSPPRCTPSPRRVTMLPVSRTASSTLSRLGSYLRLTHKRPSSCAPSQRHWPQPLLETLRLVEAVEPVERDADLRKKNDPGHGRATAGVGLATCKRLAAAGAHACLFVGGTRNVHGKRWNRSAAARSRCFGPVLFRIRESMRGKGQTSQTGRRRAQRRRQRERAHGEASRARLFIGLWRQLRGPLPPRDVAVGPR